MPWEGLHPAGDPNQYSLQGEHPVKGYRLLCTQVKSTRSTEK